MPSTVELYSMKKVVGEKDHDDSPTHPHYIRRRLGIDPNSQKSDQAVCGSPEDEACIFSIYHASTSH